MTSLAYGYDITGFCVHSDIDECIRMELNTCDMICVNTVGDFRCDCRSGYQLNQKDGRTCEGTQTGYYGAIQVLRNADGGGGV